MPSSTTWKYLQITIGLIQWSWKFWNIALTWLTMLIGLSFFWLLFTFDSFFGLLDVIILMGNLSLSPKYRKAFNKRKHMHDTVLHCTKVCMMQDKGRKIGIKVKKRRTWQIKGFITQNLPENLSVGPCSDMVINYLNADTKITHTHISCAHTLIHNCKLNYLAANNSSVIYTYNVGFPLNFVIALSASSRLRTMDLAEYVIKYNCVQSSVF